MTPSPRIVLVLGLLALLAPASPDRMPRPDGSTVTAFENGLWFDGRTFVPGTRYVVDGRLHGSASAEVDVVIDLDGQYVVPPYGEAHNHWLEPDLVETYVAHYLHRGVFYVKDQSTVIDTRRRIASRVDRPDSVDYVAANQGFTGPGGHPLQIVGQMQALGAIPPEWGAEDIDGRAVMVIEDQDDLESSWPIFLEGEPDFVKVYLLYSDLHEERSLDERFLYRRGLDPAFLPWIVEHAHASGLEVSAHVYSAADFRTAVEAGVDQIAHMPGIGFETELGIDAFRITAADAELAAERNVTVVTTLSTASEGMQAGDPLVEEVLRPNLQLLWEHGVSLLIGSDQFRETSDVEARRLLELELLAPDELLRLWCVDTPRSIFPDREIGRLEDGFEASFLVLEGDPLEDFENTQRIALRVKQGRLLFPRDRPFPPLRPR